MLLLSFSAIQISGNSGWIPKNSLLTRKGDKSVYQRAWEKETKAHNWRIGQTTCFSSFLEKKSFQVAVPIICRISGRYIEEFDVLSFNRCDGARMRDDSLTVLASKLSGCMHFLAANFWPRGTCILTFHLACHRLRQCSCDMVHFARPRVRGAAKLQKLINHRNRCKGTTTMMQLCNASKTEPTQSKTFRQPQPGTRFEIIFQWIFSQTTQHISWYKSQVPSWNATSLCSNHE